MAATRMQVGLQCTGSCTDDSLVPVEISLPRLHCAPASCTCCTSTERFPTCLYHLTPSFNPAMLWRSTGLMGLWRAPHCLRATTRSRWVCVCSAHSGRAMFALEKVRWRHGLHCTLLAYCWLLAVCCMRVMSVPCLPQPLQFFTVQCEWASTGGCTSLPVKPGLPRRLAARRLEERRFFFLRARLAAASHRHQPCSLLTHTDPAPPRSPHLTAVCRLRQREHGGAAGPAQHPGSCLPAQHHLELQGRPAAAIRRERSAGTVLWEVSSTMGHHLARRATVFVLPFATSALSSGRLLPVGGACCNAGPCVLP